MRKCFLICKCVFRRKDGDKMKKKTKENILGLILIFLIVTGLAYVITFVWQMLEIILYNEIQHRLVDDIIATILLISLLFNLKYAVEKLGLEEEDEQRN